MRAEASAVAAPPVALELDLDVFDGPFDLLVTLILRDEIDIWEVRVSRIIAEYVVHLADTGEFDLDATSQFVVLVAALLEMKSRLLLEEDVEEELEDLDPDEAARQLLERLVRYSQFRNAAGSAQDGLGRDTARGCTATRRCRRSCCAGASPTRRCPPARSRTRSARCCASRPSPTPATSPTSPCLSSRSCAACGSSSTTRASSPSRRWRRATGSSVR